MHLVIMISKLDRYKGKPQINIDDRDRYRTECRFMWSGQLKCTLWEIALDHVNRIARLPL